MQSVIPSRLQALREQMKKNGVTAYLVPTDDFHNSEYVGEYFKCRRFITGFTGSAGTALITLDNAWLWTDGRYFLQASMQLEGTGISLMKMNEPGVPSLKEFLKDHLSAQDVLGFDGRTLSAAFGRELEEALFPLGVTFFWDQDLIDPIWEDRPPLSAKPVWTLSHIYTGKERSEKIRNVRRDMAGQKADYFVLTSLDDIAWLLNVRGDDVSCNPVFLAYLIMSQDRLYLYAQESAFSPQIRRELEQDGITLRPYQEFYEKAASLRADCSVLLDPSSINYALLRKIPEAVTIVEGKNPTTLPKAMKNSVEAANSRKAHIKDGVAVTRFIYWLKTQAGRQDITELSAAIRLERFRKEQKNYLGPSFSPIIGYAEHAAIIHYSATAQSNASIQAKGMLLADTGGQYLEGTTDITRTIVLGEITDEEKEYFTRVLQGHLRLLSARFLHGSSGKNLDYLAREPLWEIGEDYNHGTGHGVGFVLNVHEGPQRIHWRDSEGTNTPFEEGMITSDEPGYYRDGAFGIRHENLMICVKEPMQGTLQFMHFEPLTMVPFDLDGIDPDLMSPAEKKLLNEYHQMVYKAIADRLPAEEKEWLKTATREI